MKGRDSLVKVYKSVFWVCKRLNRAKRCISDDNVYENLVDLRMQNLNTLVKELKRHYQDRRLQLVMLRSPEPKMAEELEEQVTGREEGIGSSTLASQVSESSNGEAASLIEGEKSPGSSTRQVSESSDPWTSSGISTRTH